MNKVFVPHDFHRALRKCLDSDASSVCWNAINLTNPEQWARFISEMEKYEEGSLEDRCRGLFLYGESAMNLLNIGLRMLTSEEYKVLEEYSMVDEGENK